MKRKSKAGIGTAIVAIILIVIIIVGGVGAYVAYNYVRSPQPSPSVSPSPTVPPTPSATTTPTPTESPATSPTPTVTPSPTVSPSPTLTITPSPTTNPISTPTSTPTPTSNPTATPSPSPSPSPTPTPNPVTLTVATTTSLHDTGLEDTGINGNTTGTIKAAFETDYPWITVNFIAQGTGAAIATAQRGDADMILVHSPSQEATFLKGGYGVDRKIVAYNFFLIVGPANDPAGISGMTNVSQALINLYNAAQTNSQIQWITRNDGSGTATAEQNLWKAAGFNYTQLLQQTSWFHATGQGMGASLLVANNGIGGGASGYIMSDTGTYLAYYDQNNIQLKPTIQGQQALLNVYSAIIDDPRNSNLTATHFDASLTFVSWLVSSKGQQVISNFGVSTYHQQLFSPFIPVATGTAPNATLLGWIQSYAYINANNTISANGTECPQQYRYNAGNLYSASYDAIPSLSPSPAAIFVSNVSTPLTTVENKRWD
jgi:tungstate transport system substrate-binding protein